MSANDILATDSVAEWLTMYIVYLRDKLYLQGWEIRIELVDSVDGDEKAHGSADLDDRYHLAVLKFRSEIEDNEFWRDVVKHEMLEIKLAYITNFVTMRRPKKGGTEEWLLFQSVYIDYKERFIQDLIPFLADDFSAEGSSKENH